jgi:hypothetical protein
MRYAQWYTHGRHKWNGIGRCPRHMYLDVQVWAGRVAGRADDADDLSDDDGLSLVDIGAGQHVAVPDDHASGVRDVHIPPFSAPRQPPRPGTQPSRIEAGFDDAGEPHASICRRPQAQWRAFEDQTDRLVEAIYGGEPQERTSCSLGWGDARLKLAVLGRFEFWRC